jgi:perosamine synthetase
VPYIQKLIKIKQIPFFDQVLKNTTPWFIDILAEKKEGLIEYLKNNNIGTRVMYLTIILQVLARFLRTWGIIAYGCHHQAN